MVHKIRLMIVALTFCTNSMFAQDKIPGSNESLSQKLKALLAKNHYSLSSVGILLRDVDKESTVIAINPDTLYNPASVSKLTTAAIAFDKFGAAFTYKTPVFYDGTFNPDSGIVNGNLYIKGSGDPSLVIERLWIFVQYLYRFCGLRGITGDVVLDDSYFDTISIGPCFDEDSDATNPYVAPVNAISANFNTVELCERPGESPDDPVRVQVFPQLPTIDVVVKAKTVASHRRGAATIIRSERADAQTRFLILGTLAQDAQMNRVIRRVNQTWDHFGAIFKMFLDENKIVFKGRVRRGRLPDSLVTSKPLFIWESPPLWEIINDMMKYSTNFYAEMLFKLFSATRDSGGGAWDKSATLSQAWWKEKGLPGNPLIMNGSGMGDCNRYSVSQLCALLSFMWSQKASLPEWLSAFPAAGIDGTLRSRFKESRLRGLVRGKTGTLNNYGVYTIAGYVLMPKATYSFAILFNNMTTKYPYQHWAMQQKILELIVP
jgi:D-alanyl-D-alanine carboxypeptidase/D-alanyl-D-alanine-endopeptidase (penicillin-binding protein 4)